MGKHIIRFSYRCAAAGDISGIIGLPHQAWQNIEDSFSGRKDDGTGASNP